MHDCFAQDLAGQPFQLVQVGDAFRMDADPRQGLGAVPVGIFSAEAADDLLDAGINVSAVKTGDPLLGGGKPLLDRLGLFYGAVSTRQLPPTEDHAGNLVAASKGKR